MLGVGRVGGKEKQLGRIGGGAAPEGIELKRGAAT